MTDDFEMQFGSQKLTQVGGYPLIEEVLEENNFRQEISRYLKIPRGKHGYTSAELSTWLVIQKFLGVRRLDHVDPYRFDPLLGEFFGIEGLASDTTMGRYLKSFSENDLSKLERYNERMSNRILSRLRRERMCHPGSGEKNPFPKQMKVTLDIDGTPLTVYGKQEQAKRGRNPRQKDTPQYRLFGVFIAGLGLMIDHQLLSGNLNLAGHGWQMYKRAEAKLPEGIEVGGIRGDAALFNGPDIKRWDKKGIIFGITAPKRDDLKKKIAALEEEDWTEYRDEEKNFVCEIAEVNYVPKSWDHGGYRTIVSRRERQIEKNPAQISMYEESPWYDYFAYMTNHEGELLEAYTFVVGRSDVENCIKEAKVGFDGKQVPHAEYKANLAYMGHVQLAYNLKIQMGLTLFGEADNRKQRERLVREFIKLPAKMIWRDGRWIISLADWWPFKKQMQEVISGRHPPPIN